MRDVDQRKNFDVAQLEKLASTLAEKYDVIDDARQEIRAIKEGGKAVGFDMAAVDAIVRLRNADRERMAKRNDALRVVAEYLGEPDPFP